MESPSPKRFESSTGLWVMVAGLLLLIAWYDYPHPLGVVMDVFIAVVLLIVFVNEPR